MSSVTLVYLLTIIVLGTLMLMPLRIKLIEFLACLEELVEVGRIPKP